MSDHPQVIVVKSYVDPSRNSVRPMLPDGKPDFTDSVRSIVSYHFDVGTVLRLVPEDEYQLLCRDAWMYRELGE